MCAIRKRSTQRTSGASESGKMVAIKMIGLVSLFYCSKPACSPYPIASEKGARTTHVSCWVMFLFCAPTAATFLDTCFSHPRFHGPNSSPSPWRKVSTSQSAWPCVSTMAPYNGARCWRPGRRVTCVAGRRQGLSLRGFKLGWGRTCGSSMGLLLSKR